MKKLLGSAAVGLCLLAVWHTPSSADTRVISTTAQFSAGNAVNVVVTSDGDGAAVMSPVVVPGGWQECAPLPQAVSHHAAAYYDGRIYCIGGRQGAGGEFLRDVYVSTIGPDGLPGNWVPTTPLPEGRAFHAAVAYSGYVYVVGGDKPGFEVTPEVLYAPVGADGQLGMWRNTSPIPDEAGRDLAGLAVAYGRLYLVAGAPNGGFYGTDTVYSAPIRPDGSLGAWEEDRALPADAARLGAPALFAYGRLYLIGGNAPILDSADSPLNSVWTAEVTPDSKLGAWTTTNEIVVPIRDSQGNTVGSRQEPRFYTGNSAVAAGGHLVVVGGHAVAEGMDQPAPVQSVLVGRLLPNGDVGEWDYAAPYPFRVSRSAAVLAGDKVVVLGGRDSAGDDRADVYA
ncbi:MAG: Kelch repeat-containing protein, partial [Armatimonadota bacterium]